MYIVTTGQEIALGPVLLSPGLEPVSEIKYTHVCNLHYFKLK